MCADTLTSTRWLTDSRDTFSQFWSLREPRCWKIWHLVSIHSTEMVTSHCVLYGTWQRGKGFHSRIIPLMDFILKALPLNTVILGNTFLQEFGGMQTFRSGHFSHRLPLFIFWSSASSTVPATQQELLSLCWMILRHFLPELHCHQTSKAHYF